MACSRPFSWSLPPPLTEEAVMLNCGLDCACPGFWPPRLTRHFGGLWLSRIHGPAGDVCFVSEWITQC